MMPRTYPLPIPEERARLYAAADDLLAACEAALGTIEFIRPFICVSLKEQFGQAFVDNEHTPIIIKLKAAIAKAKGEPAP